MNTRRPSLPVPVFVLLCVLSVVARGENAAPLPPVAEVKPVEDGYFGTRITDPYRWFEDSQNPAFTAWLKGQAEYAEHILTQIPGREILRQRVRELGDLSVSIPDVGLAGKRYFYQKTAPGDGTRKLYVRSVAEGKLKEATQAFEKAKAQLRAYVEHPFHVVKNLFRHRKVRYRGLAKHTAQLHTLFALANLVLAQRNPQT